LSPKDKENTAKVAIWLSPETHEALKKEARERGLTVSAYIRMVLIAHTKK